MAASVEEVAERSLDAFNARDLDGVLALVDEEVEFDFGPRKLHGRQEVRGFVERQLFGAGYRASNGRRYRRGDELVAESRQELSYVETGELASVEAVGVLYVVQDGRLTRYAEFPDVASALAASSVEEGDELLPA